MANKMLIDATQPEETRVVVVKGNKVDEFDFEAADRAQLRGNIYLAKVTRVEPSLQAAFVDYGGNRHGFLAFSEIHPDYYQIPVADRQALIEEEQDEDKKDAENEDALDSASTESADDSSSPNGETGADDDGTGEIPIDIEESNATIAADADDDSVASEEVLQDPASDEFDADEAAAAETSEEVEDDEVEDNGDGSAVESVGAEDALEEVPERRRPRRRQYKIQEVIKRRQILLVQVVKEERGNKGAAMTTYLSLAGRYSVLMPNTARGGGISRKITNPADRKRLKSIATSLDVAEGMGVILRTAGASRTKPEIKRDFEYLLRLWGNVRTLTLQSSAPSLVYEEGSLIKRSIRDLYSKDINEVMVAGDSGYREAKDFMKMLMPSHAKNVKAYRNQKSLFSSYNIEPQLDAMFSPQVTLKSGGYLVINPTEALVSIDVNSGKSTKEHNIEDTALQTNLEAAEEVARQLRLRDLAGLIVIDFIDMDENRNNRAVERKLKDCLKSDRARIQVGRISPFGLLEMSRQRMRTGVLESTTVICPHCEGNGYVRAPSSIALQVMRGLEDHLSRTAKYDVSVRVRAEVALYILNQKRIGLMELENRFGVQITIDADPDVPAQGFEIDKGDLATGPIEPQSAALVSVDSIEPIDEADDDAEGEAETEELDEQPKRKRRRRRRGKRGGQNADQANDPNEEQSEAEADATESDAEASDENGVEVDDSDEEDGEGQRRKRRRGKRGGRRNRRRRGGEDANGEEAGTESEADASDVGASDADGEEDGNSSQNAPSGTAATTETNPDSPAANGAEDAQVLSEAEPAAEEPEVKPKRRRGRKTKAEKAAEEAAKAEIEAQGSAEQASVIEEPASETELPAPAETAAEESPAMENVPTPQSEEPADTKPKKRGWWRR